MRATGGGKVVRNEDPVFGAGGDVVNPSKYFACRGGEGVSGGKRGGKRGSL